MPRTRFDRLVVTVPHSGYEHDHDLTRQEFKDDSNLNKIMSDFASTGRVPMEKFRHVQARYEDVSAVPDYPEIHRRVTAANEAFMQLPAEVRKRFRNDPAELVKAIETPEGQDLLVELGLATRREKKEAPGQSPSKGGGKPAATAGSKAVPDKRASVEPSDQE